MESPAFLATPVPPGQIVSAIVRQNRSAKLPEQLRKQIGRRLGLASEIIP